MAATHRSRTSRIRLVLVALAVVLLAAACKVDTTVTVKVEDDGSGVVSVTAVLDPDAVKSAESGGGKLEDRVRLGDLAPAGWTAQPWARAADGSAQLTLTKPFSTPEQATEILQENGHAASPDAARRITTTLEALATWGTTSGAPQAGRLTDDIDPPGFEALAALVPRPGGGKSEAEVTKLRTDPKAVGVMSY